MTTPTPEFIDAITTKLVDEGLLIEAGFHGLMLAAYKGAGPEQTEMMREAFFAGAQHLFASIMGVLSSDDDDVTDADEQRMENIHNELGRFIDDFAVRHNLTQR